MKLGDFTKLAKHYHNRPEYSLAMSEYLLKIAGYHKQEGFSIADVGAGTGKFTTALKNIAPNADIIAVEPNDEMRAEGQKTLKDIEFKKGSAEQTGLCDGAFDFVSMADSFHWPNHSLAMPEFKRILKPGGYFAAIWRSRDIAKNELMLEIENKIKEMIPPLKRVASALQRDCDWANVIKSTGDFENCVYLEMPFIQNFSKERYMGIWHSVNDIQAQATEYGGEQLWNDIIAMIEGKIANLENIEAHYVMKAYVAKSTK